jgi:hypothetical protein
MTEPTKEQKLQAAQTALEAMQPPVPETDVTTRLVEVVVEVFWSQVPFLMEPKPSTLGPMFCELLQSDAPELQAEIAALNASATKLAMKIHAEKLQEAAP